MAYEHDPITGRSISERPVGAGRSGSAPWLILAGVVLAVLVLLFAFGGGRDQTAPTTGAPAGGGEVAPMGTAPATGTETAPAAPAGDAAPVAPVD
ncbi:MAG: hypothetical protein JJU15_06855 [Pararhodobacter sp.]|nr:hypothetical protein [Pararhodobacter sp.]